MEETPGSSNASDSSDLENSSPLYQTNRLDPSKASADGRAGRVAFDPIMGGTNGVDLGTNGQDLLDQQPGMSLSSGSADGTNGQQDETQEAPLSAARELHKSGNYPKATSEASREEATQRAFELFQEVMGEGLSLEEIKRVLAYNDLSQGERAAQNNEILELKAREEARVPKFQEIIRLLGGSDDIWIVEDEVSELFVLKLELERVFGAQNLIAEPYSQKTQATLEAVLSPSASVQLREKNTPMIVILDLRMKGITGYQLRRIIADLEKGLKEKNVKGHIPSTVVILSGEADDDVYLGFAAEGLPYYEPELDERFKLLKHGDRRSVRGVGEDLFFKKPALPTEFGLFLNWTMERHIMNVIRSRQEEAAAVN